MTSRAAPPILPELPAQTRQAILVTAVSWASQTGTLQKYDKTGNVWRATGPVVRVSLGKGGLAWGAGLHRPNERQKREGDGKAPAGIFELGPAFGYARKAPAGCRWPYRATTERDYLVDDPESPEYNQLVTISGDRPNTKSWKSAEKMKRSDSLYELGLMVRHNFPRVIKNKGSAIFFHIWKKPGAPTVGCTAMARENLLDLILWLDPERHPLLVQAPVEEIKNMALVHN
jgi:D-alanyl-D-alanine dipeptidase